MRTGALWIYFQGGVSSIIQFATGIILARILEPSDFGVFYAVVAFTSLLLLQTQFGIPESLIRSKNVTPAQWNSAFWFMQGIALLCVLAIAGLSSWLQGYYDDNRFTTIIWLMSITILLAPISAICGTWLRRDMDYKTVSRITIIVGLVAVVISISCALLGFGPFSMVIAGIVSGIISAILFVRNAPWRPSWPVDIYSIGSILSYGWRIHLNGSLSLTARKVDNMLVGSLAGISSLGIYNRALSTAQMPVTEITGRLYQLFFSGLSRIQDDMAHTISMYKKVLCAMTNAAFPFLLVFIFAPEGFINFLYGEKWLPAALPLQILAIGSMPFVIAVTMGSLADAQNLVSKETPIQIFNLVFTVVAVWIGSVWGLIGIAIGITIKSTLLMILLQAMLSRSHVKLKWSIMLEGIGPALGGSIVASVITLSTIASLEAKLESTGFTYLCIITAVVFFSYGSTLLLISRLFPNNEALEANLKLFGEFLSKLQSKLNKRSFG